MGLGDGVNKRESEPVSGRVLSFHETLKYAAANFRGETRPIILYDQLGIALVSPEPNVDLAAGREMYEFIFQQIAQRAIDKPEVGLDYRTVLQVSSYLMMPVRHGRQVQMNQLIHNMGKVHRHPLHRKGSRFGFGDI